MSRELGIVVRATRNTFSLVSPAGAEGAEGAAPLPGAGATQADRIKRTMSKLIVVQSRLVNSI
jgi:hypothetical protein